VTDAVVSRTATIKNQRGLHARAAALFVKTAARFESQVSVSKGGQTVSGSSIMGLMMLAACIGSDISLEAEGPDAVEAMKAICQMIEDRFDEE